MIQNRRLLPYRQRVVGAAEGRVLEIGIGSGFNLPFYGPKVSCVFGLGPSARLLRAAASTAARMSVPFRLLPGSAAHIPLDGHSIETVIMTWVGCGIPDIVAALYEMRRVLRPGGRLLFVEHGRSPDPGIERWQDRIAPLWRRISGGCHLNRKVDKIIESAEFRIDRLHTAYMQGPKALTFMYEGSAQPQ